MGHSSVRHEKYEPKIVDTIEMVLKNALRLNQPRFYEVLVNDLVVVPKTDDVEQLDEYENFITEDTSIVKIFVYHYNQKSSDKYFLHISPDSLAQAKTRELSGVVPIAKNEDELKEKWEKDNHYLALIEENRQLLTDIEVLEETVAKAVKENKCIREKRDKEFKQKAADALEGILESDYVKKNLPLANIIKDFFGGAKIVPEENLSGTEDDDEDDEEVEEIHQRVLSIEEEKHLLLLKDIKAKVGTTHLASIMYLLDLFATNPSSIESAIKVVKNYIARKPRSVPDLETETETD